MGLKRTRGNKNWGQPITGPIQVSPTEFERQARLLGLSEKKYAKSAQLREWCKHHRNRCYVPEWLLEEWHLVVETSS
jgi:hypothetical protein